MCSAETVKDKAGKPWTCRAPDDKIYTMDGVGIHVYNIQAAKDKGEAGSEGHDPICIRPMMDSMKWKWPGEKNIQVNFTPLTAGCKGQPFRTAPGNSNISDTLESDVALDTYSNCAYKLNFTSTGGSFDPHIIIKGARLALQIKELNDQIKGLEEKMEQLNGTLKQVKKDLEHLEKQEEKEEKHHE